MEEKNKVVKKANQFICRMTNNYEYRKEHNIKIPLNNVEVINNVNKGLAGQNLLIALDYDRRQIDQFLKEYGFKAEEETLDKSPSKTKINEDSSVNLNTVNGLRGNKDEPGWGN